MKRSHFQIIILSFFFSYCVCESDLGGEHENKILKFRADLDQLGIDFENFFFDIVMEAMNSYEKMVNPLAQQTETFHSNQKALQDLVKQYSSQIQSQFQSQLQSQLELQKKLNPTVSTTISPSNLLDSYLNNKMFKHKIKEIENRVKRDVESSNTVINKEEFAPTCSLKTQQERQLEQRHLDDLKKEITKLTDMIYLLRNQQKTMSNLDEFMDSNNLSAEKLKPKGLINILTNLDKSSDRSILDTNSLDHNENEEQKYPVHEELSNLKHDLRQTIALLNMTRIFLAEEQQQGLLLKNEMKRLNEELSDVRMMMKQIHQYNNISAVSRPEARFDEFLGTPMHIPKSLPLKITSPFQQRAFFNEKSNKSKSEKKMSDDEDARARSSNFDRLLRELDNGNEISTEIDGLQRELQRNKNRENLKTLLRIILKNQEKSSSKDLVSHETDTSKQLRKLLNALEKSQGRIQEDNVEDDLKQLEQAINYLQSPESTSNGFKELRTDDLLKLLVVDILERRDDKNPSNLPITKGDLSPTQIAELRKRLDQIINNSK